MKTKPFLLATAGSTVDGRVIDENLLKEMASSYDPKTYGARLNIEHIRGVSGDKPFRAYGDVLELSTAEVEVNFNGKTEKRLGLFGTFDVTEDAKQLNAQGQKVYPSIEIEPNFGGKGHAYLMGCALTDSPASIATERLQFNRTLPGVITLARGDAGQGTEPLPLEFAEAADADAGGKFLAGLDGVLGKFFGKAPAKEQEGQQQQADPAAPAQFNADTLKPLFEQLGQQFAAGLAGVRQDFRADLDQLSIKVAQMEKTIEARPDNQHTQRPTAAGANGKFAVTDC